MTNELVLAWAKLIAAGIGTVLAGITVFLVQRFVTRKDAQGAFLAKRKEEEEKKHIAAHKRYERNFLRISEHSDVKLEIETD